MNLEIKETNVNIFTKKTSYTDNGTKIEVIIDNLGFIHTKMSYRIQLPEAKSLAYKNKP